MRIIQTRGEVSEFMRRRDKADKGCWRCPACGHEIEHMPKPRIEKAASIFFNKYVMIDRFGCAACGCVWEGEPYTHDKPYIDKKDDGLEYAFNS